MQTIRKDRHCVQRERSAEIDRSYCLYVGKQCRYLLQMQQFYGTSTVLCPEALNFYFLNSDRKCFKQMTFSREELLLVKSKKKG